MDSTQRKTFFIITIALIMITLQQVASCPPTPTKSDNNEAEKQQLKINEHKQQAGGQENAAASTDIKQLIRHQRSIQPQLEQQLQLDDAQALKRQLPVSETNTTSTLYVQLLFPLSHSHPAS